MRIGIFGAGLVGGYLGGRLALAGHDVHFVARPRLYEAWQREGLTLESIDGFAAHLAPGRFGAGGVEGMGDRELVLVTVKCGQSAEAARALAPVLSPRTMVVSFQNGVDAASELTRALGRPVLRGMVPFNVVARRLTHLHQATSGTLVVERGAASLARAFRAAGLPARVDADILAVQWGKLLLNLNNAVNALSGLPLRAELSNRGYREALAACMAEGLEVTRRAGLKPRIDVPVPLRLLPRLLRLPTPLFRILSARMLRIDAAARSSMLEDLEAGRSTEVDALNGAIVRLAEAHGADAPKNRAMVRAITACHGRSSPRLPPDALLALLAG